MKEPLTGAGSFPQLSVPHGMSSMTKGKVQWASPHGSFNYAISRN